MNPRENVGDKTAEAVASPHRPPYTQLKLGVNERGNWTASNARRALAYASPEQAGQKKHARPAILIDPTATTAEITARSTFRVAKGQDKCIERKAEINIMTINKTTPWHLDAASKFLAAFIDSWLSTGIRDKLAISITVALLIPGTSSMNLPTHPPGKLGVMHAALACMWLFFLAMYSCGRRLNDRERTKAAEQASHAQRMMALEDKRKANNLFKAAAQSTTQSRR